MRFGLIQTVAPAEEPLTLGEVKEHLRIDDDSQDAELNGIIAAARKEFETQTFRQLITATWELRLDKFPSGRTPITLPRAPLLLINSIQYVDPTDVSIPGALLTLDAAKYQVSLDREPARLVPVFNENWPTARSNEADAVRINFDAGYGARAAVDDLIKQALKLMCGAFYEFREETISGTVARLIPRGATRIMALYELGDDLLEYA